jgi:hypothetical protein
MSNIIPYGDMQQMAEVAASSKMFGFKNPQEAMAIMLLCQAEGLHPAIAMRDYHVIQNRPALKADAMLARFQQAGGAVKWDVYTDQEVTGTFSHPSGGSLSVTWLLSHAKQIGIASKDNWKNYPRAMLRARCISEGIRAVYPGCVVGVYTPEEVQDFQPAPSNKDMGMVEEVQLPAVPQEPDGAFALYVPGNDQPYNRFHTVEGWLQGYVDMIARIHNSTKMPDGLKAEKIDSLKVCNMDMLDSLDSFQKIKIKSFMVQAGVPVTKKQDTPPQSPEVVHSETIS